MRTQGSKTADERMPGRPPARAAAPTAARQRPGTSSAQALVALQGAAGNAAVVQMLRRRGYFWAQEQDQHGPGCGHQQSEQPAVQRSAVHDVLRTSGRPLDDATRTDMESRLGADFSDVRIHNDSAAKASAAEVGARAYTSGNHVVIGGGGGDKHTLAHELTHVIQQRQGPVAGTDNGSGLSISDPSDRFEQAAEANASRVMARSAPDVQRAAFDAPLEQRGPAAIPTVQRFTKGAPTGVLGGVEDSAHFVTQSPDAVLRPGKSPNKLIDHAVDHMDAQTQHPGDVSLLISDDGTLAVHDTEREPKEFYATSEVFTRSNNALEQANSEYTLVQAGGGIKTEHGELSRITPMVRKEAQKAKASGFADLIEHQCIEVARKVVGSYAMEVVLEGAPTEYKPWGGGGVGGELASRVAATVKSGQATGSTGADAGAGKEPDQPGAAVAKEYGTALREHPVEADNAAQVMGINNHARPGVGEAFATLSIGNKERIDYATAEAGKTSTDRTAVDVWNYHFAGVVARSLDTADWVTLENYTRNQQAEKALHELAGKLLDEYREKTKGWFSNREGKTPTGVFESDRTAEMITKLGNTSRAKALSEYQALGTNEAAWKQKWFFRMYGSQAGQRFHEKQYNGGQGDFVNPLTVRVRAARQTPESSG